MSQQLQTFEISVIVFREDSAWTALALEMNIRGYGETQQDAVKDVLDMLAAQVSFAIQQGHPESVWAPAEPKYWQMFEQARKNQFVAHVSGSEAPTDQLADLVPLPLLASSHANGWTTTRA